MRPFIIFIWWHCLSIFFWLIISDASSSNFFRIAVTYAPILRSYRLFRANFSMVRSARPSKKWLVKNNGAQAFFFGLTRAVISSSSVDMSSATMPKKMSDSSSRSWFMTRVHIWGCLGRPLLRTDWLYMETFISLAWKDGSSTTSTISVFSD